MEIKRVTEYNNPLFSEIALKQRGAFLIDEEPYEIEIISSDSAFVKGKNREIFKKLIEYFRYYSPHINNFFDENNKKIISFEKNFLFNFLLASSRPTINPPTPSNIENTLSFDMITSFIFIQNFSITIS